MGGCYVRKSSKLQVLGASLSAMALSGVAHAQEATPHADSDSAGIGEIIVTAQKRSENLQKTPAAVTALAGDSMVQTGATDLRAVQNLVPAARFQQEGATTQVILRGVGSNLDFGNVEPTVAFKVNGVYLST
jgi:iron complex outermembrane recepter protein